MPAVAAVRPARRPTVSAATGDPQPRWDPPAAEAVAPLDGAVIVFYRKDLWQARSCVASVRHWAPELPILLLADHAAGEVPLGDFERHFDAEPFPGTRRCYGSPLSMLAVLFRPERKRYLVLDADTALLGPVVPLLERVAGDFVVSPNHRPAADIEPAYFDPEKIRAGLDPDYEYPGWVFNTGQLVVTSGLLTPDDFAELVDWTGERPRNLRRDLFSLNDQPRMNLALHRLRAAGRVTVGGVRFKVNPDPKGREADALPTVAQIAAKSDRCPPAVCHWLRHRGPSAASLPGGEIVRFHERQFFAACGRSWERPVRSAGRRTRAFVNYPFTPRGKAAIRNVFTRR